MPDKKAEQAAKDELESEAHDSKWSQIQATIARLEIIAQKYAELRTGKKVDSGDYADNRDA